MIKHVVLKQPEKPEEHVPIEVIADSIVAISEGIKKLRAGRLNDKALILLIVNSAPGYGGKYTQKKHVSAWQVKAVLDGLEGLEREYLKPRAKK